MDALGLLRIYKRAQQLRSEARGAYKEAEKRSCIQCDNCMEGGVGLYCYLGADYHFEDCVDAERVILLTKEKSLTAEADRLMELFNKELLLID